jgi:ribonucleoside-diphosphate reductase beta chain
MEGETAVIIQNDDTQHPVINKSTKRRHSISSFVGNDMLKEFIDNTTATICDPQDKDHALKKCKKVHDVLEPPAAITPSDSNHCPNIGSDDDNTKSPDLSLMDGKSDTSDSGNSLYDDKSGESLESEGVSDNDEESSDEEEEDDEVEDSDEEAEEDTNYSDVDSGESENEPSGVHNEDVTATTTNVKGHKRERDEAPIDIDKELVAFKKQKQVSYDDEPLLCTNPNRFVLFKFESEEMWRMYKTAEASFWTTEEIDLEEDIICWKEKLNKDERHFISTILAFFAASDGIVNENLACQFMNEVQLPEARAFYGFQIAMENIHSETYATLIKTYVKNPEEQERLFNAMYEIPCIKRKAEWTMKWINPHQPFAVRLVAFAAVEGIFFSGSFCAIFWLKKRGLMPGLCQSNELISRDEGMHCDFACLCHSVLKNKPPKKVIRAIIKEAVDIEKEFLRDALPVSLIGMNADLMCKYIEFVADRLLVALGCGKTYMTPNPFDWMNMIALQRKTNFFEKHVSEYQKAQKSKKDGIVIKGTENVFQYDEEM